MIAVVASVTKGSHNYIAYEKGKSLRSLADYDVF